MNELSLKEFISPFSDTTSYLKSVNIVVSYFSELKENYDQVVELIRRSISENLSTELLVKFVKKINMFPALYGLEFFKTFMESKDEIRNESIKSSLHTTVISPSVVQCIFCINCPLINKKIRFAKNPILYAHNKIG